MRRFALPLVIMVLALASVPATSAATMGKPSVAALQAALAAKGLYTGTIDGIRGKRTDAAVRRLQARRGLAVDGIVGAQTRKALGRLARHRIGSRALRFRMVGFDVSALQFTLAWHGFASGPFDGVFGPRLERAVVRFQTRAGLAADGVAGRATNAALLRPPPRAPVSIGHPLPFAITSGFGPRGDRFHEGVDIPAPKGTPVRAVRAGTVTATGWNDGYGRLVVVSHGGGVETYYAHLRHIDVRAGQAVSAGAQVGRVGSSGNSSGPHLHLELRVRGGAVDPLPALD